MKRKAMIEVRRDSFTDALDESLYRFRDQYAERFAVVQERLKALENQRISPQTVHGKS